VTPTSDDPRTGLPTEAVVNLVRNALARLHEEAPGTPPLRPLPVNAQAWNRSLAELELSRIAAEWCSFGARVASALTGTEAGAIRTTSEAFVEVTISLDEALDVLRCYEIIPGTAATVGVRDAVIAACSYVLQAAERTLGGVADELSCPWLAGLAAPAADDGAADVFEVVFGVPRGALTDSRGAVSAARLIEALHPNQVDGLRRLAEMATCLVQAPLSRDQLLYVIRVLLDDGSAFRLRTARRVRRTILRSFEQDPARTAAALKDLRSGTDRYAESSRRILLLQSGAADTADVHHQVTLRLDTYVKFVEGQLRPWAWTYRRMLSGGVAKPPELGRLVPMLSASGDPFMVAASQAMLVQIRNAVAHDDWTYDPETVEVVTEGLRCPVGVVLVALERAHSLVGGAEIGWATARAESEPLRAAMDVGDPHVSPVYVRRRAAQTWYGDNGVSVVDDDLTGGVYKVVLAAVGDDRFNPVLQATIQSAGHVDADRYEVWIAAGRRPLLSVTRACVERNFPLWRAAVAAFDVMPTSAFLVLATAARAEVETQPRAAHASAVHAVDDVVRAFANWSAQAGSRHCAQGSRLPAGAPRSPPTSSRRSAPPSRTQPFSGRSAGGSPTSRMRCWPTRPAGTAACCGPTTRASPPGTRSSARSSRCRRSPSPGPDGRTDRPLRRSGTRARQPTAGNVGDDTVHPRGG
jgi:hypothetical protein